MKEADRIGKTHLCVRLLCHAALVTVIVGTTSISTGQEYKMTTPITPGVATPDKLNSSIGTLHLSDDSPS